MGVRDWKFALDVIPFHIDRRRVRMRRFACLILIFLASLSGVAQSQKPAEAAPYKNQTLPVERRVQDLRLRSHAVEEDRPDVAVGLARAAVAAP